jgi:hypothetical protein
MDIKNIAASAIISVITALAVVGGDKITDKPPRELTLPPGASTLDVAVAEVAQRGDLVGTISADLRKSVVDDTYGLHWWCGAEPCTPKIVVEITKAAEDATVATRTPYVDGDTVRYRVVVVRGTAPDVPDLSPEDTKLLGAQNSRAQ